MPTNEHERLQALSAYLVMDTPPEQAYDDVTRLAAALCDAPIALITLVDEHRQWFKSRVGLDVTETPREHSICAHAMTRDDLLVVEDASKDDRFAGSPLVEGHPNIRFYAGAPLHAREGTGMGALCVIDSRPRELTDEQADLLRALGRQVSSVLELRRLASDLAHAVARVQTLEGLLRICESCSAIYDDATETWQRLEAYVEARTEAVFSHRTCPTCQDEQRGLDARPLSEV